LEYALGDVNSNLLTFYRKNGIIAQGLRQRREKLVTKIIWRAAALDPSLVTEPQKLNLLHRIVDRRLRTVERLLYSVGFMYGSTFEYPRQGEPTQVNQEARDYWDVEPNVRVTLTRLGKDDVFAAVEKLFEPQPVSDARNHLYCDQVIHVLHLEAWLFTRKKWEGEHEADPTILAEKGYVSITSSWVEELTCGEIPEEEIKIQQPFIQEEVDIDHLQIGDQLIVYNHPAYDNAARGDARWRLENVIVLDTGLNPSSHIVMGHGMRPQTVFRMRIEMGKKFQSLISEMRSKVTSELLHTPGIESIPWLKQSFLEVGLEFKTDLEKGTLSNDFRLKFEKKKVTLSPNELINIEPELENYRWRIDDSGQGITYYVVATSETLYIYDWHETWLIKLQPKERPIPQDRIWPPYDDEWAVLADWWLMWRVGIVTAENMENILRGRGGLVWSDFGFLEEARCIKKACESEEFKLSLWDNHAIAFIADPGQDDQADKWSGYGHCPLWMPRKKGTIFPFNILGDLIAYKPSLLDLYFGGGTGGWHHHHEPNEAQGAKIWVIKPMEY
jgi:hypothetical protein